MFATSSHASIANNNQPAPIGLATTVLRLQKESTLSLLKRLKAQLLNQNASCIRVRHCRRLYDLILFSHKPFGLGESIEKQHLKDLEAGNCMSPLWSTQAKELFATTTVTKSNGLKTKCESNDYAKASTFLQLRLSSVFLLDKSKRHKDSKRLQQAFDKILSFHTTSKATISRGHDDTYVRQKAILQVVEVLMMLRHRESMCRPKPSDSALLGHPPGQKTEPHCAPSIAINRIHICQGRHTEHTRPMFNSATRIGRRGHKFDNMRINDSDPLYRQPIKHPRREKQLLKQGTHFDQSHVPKLLNKIIDSPPKLRKNGISSNLNMSRGLCKSNLFGALHHTSLILPSSTALPEALRLQIPKLKRVEKKSCTDPPNPQQHEDSGGDTEPITEASISQHQGIKVDNDLDLLNRIHTANANIHVQTMGPKVKYDDINSCKTSERIPIATLWYENIISKQSLHSGVQMRKPTKPTSPHCTVVLTAKDVQPGRRDIGWDVCDDASHCENVATTHGRWLPVSEMNESGVYNWNRKHFSHVFAKMPIQISDESLCCSALQCMQAVPSTLFVLDESTATNTHDKHRQDCRMYQNCVFRLRKDMNNIALSTKSHGPIVVRDFIKKITDFGTLVRRLWIFSEYFVNVQQSRSILLSAFASCINQTVLDCRQAVAMLMNSRNNDDLLQIMNFAENAQKPLLVLAQLCFLEHEIASQGFAVVAGISIALSTFANGTTFFRGAELLTYLYQFAKDSCLSSVRPQITTLQSKKKLAAQSLVGYHQSAANMPSSIIRKVFQITIVPYLNMLEQWIYKGHVDNDVDPYNEFAFAHVKEYDLLSSSSTVSDDFNMYGIHVPIFFSNNDINAISRIGLFMQILRAARQYNHASLCMLDSVDLRRKQRYSFSLFGLKLEFHELQSSLALAQAQIVWKHRMAKLQKATTAHRIQREANVRAEIENLVISLRQKRQRVQRIWDSVEAQENRATASKDAAKKVWLEESKIQADRARSRRQLAKIKNVEDQLQVLRDREMLPSAMVIGSTKLPFFSKSLKEEAKALLISKYDNDVRELITSNHENRETSHLPQELPKAVNISSVSSAKEASMEDGNTQILPAAELKIVDNIVTASHTTNIPKATATQLHSKNIVSQNSMVTKKTSPTASSLHISKDSHNADLTTDTGDDNEAVVSQLAKLHSLRHQNKNKFGQDYILPISVVLERSIRAHLYAQVDLTERACFDLCINNLDMICHFQVISQLMLFGNGIYSMQFLLNLVDLVTKNDFPFGLKRAHAHAIRTAGIDYLSAISCFGYNVEKSESLSQFRVIAANLRMVHSNDVHQQPKDMVFGHELLKLSFESIKLMKPAYAFEDHAALKAFFPADVLDVYDKVSSKLLTMQMTHHWLKKVWKQVVVLKRGRLARATATPGIFPAKEFLQSRHVSVLGHELIQLIQLLEAYFKSDVIHACWISFMEAFDNCSKISEVTNAHAVFISNLRNGFFLPLSDLGHSNDASSAGSSVSHVNTLANALDSILENIKEFCSLVLNIHTATTSKSIETPASNPVWMSELHGIHYSVNKRLSDILSTLHALDRSTHPNSPLLNRLKAVPFWDIHVELSF